MNLTLVAGQLRNKYFNQALTVSRGDYAELGVLLIVVMVIGLRVPARRHRDLRAARVSAGAANPKFA